MTQSPHQFHIPVMGTGFSIDSAIRVAHFGISTVISLVDDIVMERLRRYYCRLFNLPYEPVSPLDPDGRAKRTTAYLNMVYDIVQINMAAVRAEPFFENNQKQKYFDMLPDNCSLKNRYLQLLSNPHSPDRKSQERALTADMVPGAIDVNIMVKLDRVNTKPPGGDLEEHTDAKTALRGFAHSKLDASVVLSAGINQKLFTYMTNFREFYRDETGRLKKRIILKVSDFRSTLIQGKFLAKKGLEVAEFRIESGLNCGGHAFPSNGFLLPALLQEFKENREALTHAFHPKIKKYYEARGWPYPPQAPVPILTVQGGIGNHGEVRRLMEDFGMATTGWATPFLLVPEATGIDATTLNQLKQAGASELYISDASPLNIPFNNLKNSGSEVQARQMADRGIPGSSCPKGYLVSSTEFTEKPLCLASKHYQEKKLAQIMASDYSEFEKKQKAEEVIVKACICHQLSNSLLISLGLESPRDAPQSICPGPNLAWFSRTYTLKEMTNHIYGRGDSLVPAHRPHMFAAEITLYVDYLDKLATQSNYSPQNVKVLEDFKHNLEKGIRMCLAIAKKAPFKGENLNSIPVYAARETARMEKIFSRLQEEVRQAGNKSAAKQKVIQSSLS